MNNIRRNETHDNHLNFAMGVGGAFHLQRAGSKEDLIVIGGLESKQFPAAGCTILLFLQYNQT